MLSLTVGSGPGLMKLHYYPETNSLCIELTDRTSIDSQEASPGVVLDFDSNGAIVGIDIENASVITDVSGLNGTLGTPSAAKSGHRYKMVPMPAKIIRSLVLRFMGK